MTIEERLKPYEAEIRTQMESVDWDAISDLNRLEAIGCELYEMAANLEDMGYPNTVTIAAVLMDGFRAHYLPKMNRGDGRHIANGFAQALMRSHIATNLDDEEDNE